MKRFKADPKVKVTRKPIAEKSEFEEEFKDACLEAGGEFKFKPDKGVDKCKIGRNSLVFERFSRDAMLEGPGVEGHIDNVNHALAERDSVLVVNPDMNRLRIRKTREGVI